MKRTLTLTLFVLCSFLSFSQSTFFASGSDDCLSYEMNIQYNSFSTWNGATIYGNFQDSNINKYIGWNSGRWYILVFDWTISSYVYLYENTTGSISGPPPLTGWVPTSSCSGLTPPTLSTVLPVELNSFTARVDDESVILHWQTSTETNNKGFEVQRSADTRTWNELDFLTGHGTTSEIQSYEFIDSNPLRTTGYYRLKQMDYNGNYEYSDIVSISPSLNTQFELSIFPNPAASQLYFSYPLDKHLVEVFNLQGIKLISKEVIGNELDISTISQGNYLLKITHPMNNQVLRFQKI